MPVVIYVGNFRPPQSTENHVRRALLSLGVTVVTLQEDDLDFALLPHLVDSTGADLVLWTRTWTLDRTAQATALRALAARGTPTVAYHLDRYWGLEREHLVREEPYFGCSLVVTADGGHDEAWRAAGVEHRWLPPAVAEDQAILGTPREEYEARVGFIGNWQSYAHAEWAPYRRQLGGFLIDRYGPGFRWWPPRVEERVVNPELADIYASVDVVVGDSCLTGGITRYWSDRIPETLGRGGFLLHPHVDGLVEHFEAGVHLMTWLLGDWDALGRLIDRHLDDPDTRARIAGAGRDHVLAHHTYASRMLTVLGWVL